MNSIYKYIWLIKRAIKRGKPTKHFEKHHVIPKCLKKNNWTVNLTIAEHLLAHKYLVEIINHPKLIQAYFLMTHNNEKLLISNNKIIEIRTKYHAYLNSVEGKIKALETGKRLVQVHKEYYAIDPTYFFRRGKKISIGKWGKVKLEYNNLCYYNKKYLAQDVNKSIRTITSWIKQGKVVVHKNESITYDSTNRSTYKTAK